MLGPSTAVSVGVGGAIGSGIFGAPGVVANLIDSPRMILLIWLLCGGITMMQSLVSAELATRFPQAGGEYQYLKAAYGEFAAFFFGWSGTIFIIGGGGGTIAAALGEFAADLFGLAQPWAPPVLGCCAIVVDAVRRAARAPARIDFITLFPCQCLRFHNRHKGSQFGSLGFVLTK